MHLVVSMTYYLLGFALLLTYSVCYAFPENAQPPVDVGLKHDSKTSQARERFRSHLDQNSANLTVFTYSYSNLIQGINLTISINKENLKFFDTHEVTLLPYKVGYTSRVPIALSYSLDSTVAAELVNVSWLWLPPANDQNITKVLYLIPKRLGATYLLFWIREAKDIQGETSSIDWYFNDTESLRDHYQRTIANITTNDETIGFPVIVLRGKTVLQLIFRVVVILMVTVFTFTMGCELDAKLMRDYFKRPIGPAIGFFCQFFIMPLIAFGVAKVIPIQSHFGFGLLTVGCSPGGGASNAWSLLLGGDINLSILMTFISSLCALFMMPLLMFIFGRFFLDINSVTIPYGNIAIQLLQVAIPALLGLGLRLWKPKWALKFTKLTRPLFIFFIIFFMTFGIYVNWSIISLLRYYPIVIPTGALLPWCGFCLSALVAFILRQPRKLIITIAIETGIQNIGVAILVLLYSMPQPDGDLGAVMPITVALLTPTPLYFVYIGLLIKRKCVKKSQTYIAVDTHEIEKLNNSELLATNLNHQNKIESNHLHTVNDENSTI